MNGLRPCPFCGGEAEIWEGVNEEDEKIFSVWCSTGLHHVNTLPYVSPECAIKAWNERAERTCRPTAKPNDWEFSNCYCECGNKLLEVEKVLDERLLNYCSRCGTKIAAQRR